MDVLYEREINGVKLKVVKGDITQEEVEAIVNAANSYLKHGGGVAGAIVRAGGEVIQKESDEYVEKYGPLPVGSATITSAGKLKAKYVIHTVGPRWGEGDEEKKLEKAIESVLTLAKEKNIKSLSIPAVSCGIFGFPPQLGTKIIVDKVVEFLKDNPGVFEEIHFIGIGDEIPTLFVDALKSI
ncbi:MAG: macro domain-containing protein [Dictyoglomus thermophilum]